MEEPERVVARSPSLPVSLYALPLLTVLVLGVSIFWTAGDDEVRAALVLGGPTDGEVFRGRLHTFRERAFVAEPLTNHEVVVRARQGNHESSRTYRTDDAGWVEFSVDRQGADALALEVGQVDGVILARGPVDLSRGNWAAATRRRGGGGPLHEGAGLSARLSVQGRVLSVPFPGQVTLDVSRGDEPVSGARVWFSAQGAALPGKGALVTTDARGRAAIALTPLQHVASLRARVETEDAKFEFEQTLPVIPGSSSFEERSGGYVIRSPVPRDSVWFTFVTEEERLGGGRLALLSKGGGTAEAHLEASRIPKAAGLYLVLASEADGRSPATIGYPLDGQATTFDAWDAYLLDGAPRARAEAAGKQRRVRWTLGGYAALSSLCALVLFLAHVRRSDRLLSSRLREAGVESGAEERSLFPLASATLALFFAFSLGVLWIVAR